MHHFSGQEGQIDSEPRRDDSSRPSLGTINVIFVALGRTGSIPSRMMYVARLSVENSNLEPKRARIEIQPVLGFSDKDKIGTIKPYDDALVVTLRIGGYDVKRVLVDQGNAVEIMYPDLYKGLNLKPNDLQFPSDKFQGEDCYSKRSDQTTHTDRIRSGGGGFHCGRRLFPLHSYCGQTFASCFRIHHFYPAPEGEISIGGPG